MRSSLPHCGNFPFLPSPHDIMIHRLQSSQLHGCSGSGISLFQAFITTIPSPLQVLVSFHLSKSNSPYHVIFFMIFFFSDLSPDVSSPFLEILQHKNVCPYHFLAGNMLVTTQVTRPHLHFYQENSSVRSPLSLSKFLPERKTREPCSKRCFC